MPSQAYRNLIASIRKNANQLNGNASDMFVPLLRLIGDSRFVLIGEATHGSDEFYRMRAEITKLLIMNYGFGGVAVEADFPDAYRINRYVRGDEGINNADSALAEFMRFPTWMWRNEAVAEFIEWQRLYNQSIADPARKSGFYGLDLYSLNASIMAVVGYLDKVDPQAAQRARHYYGCFEGVHERNPQSYGYAVTLGLSPSCEDAVIHELVALRDRAYQYLRNAGMAESEAFFFAEQNAKVVVNAEKYYREMFQGRVSSWNLRDTHMADTLDKLIAHLSDQRGEEVKLVVWAHNSHVGDARATELGEQGEVNIGQIARERHGTESVLIGFSTYSGTVTAASEWDGAAEMKKINPGIPDSYEAVFHDTGIPNFLLILRDQDALDKELHLNRLQRAIGVLYLPETELQSHYFFSRVPEQFDAIIHLDETHAVRALEPNPLWHKGEIYEAYPTGL